MPNIDIIDPDADAVDLCLQELSARLDQLAQDLANYRKEQQDQHKELMKVLAHQEMRISVLRHRVG